VARTTYGLYIGGIETPAGSGGALDSLNPTTGEILASIADAGPEDVDRAVAAAQAAFRGSEWRGLSPTRRGRLLMRLADRIADRAEHLAELETKANGKLYKEMLVQLKIASDWLYYFGGMADKIEGRVIPLDRQSVLNYTVREPIGVVGVITPWNSPVLVTMMGMAPALAAGNTVVIKPSEIASLGVLEAMALAADAGFPPGVINVITGGPTAGRALAEHAGVGKITFTGGSENGGRVAATVSGRLGRITAELGGKSANIVFDDAQLDAAEAGLLAGIYGAGGQTCIAGSRALIQRSVYDEVVERLLERTRTMTLGDPLDSSVDMGPIATAQQRAKVESMVDRARSDGAQVLCGGRRPEVAGFPDGFFYEPTILAGAESSAFIAQEEVFGPVLVVIPFEDEDEAVTIANSSRYGLAAGVWTSHVKRAHRMARRLEAGTVWINMYRAVTFNSPFGGVKASGVGRVNGMEAIDEYLETKSVWCELGDEIQDPFTFRA
jgi:aldehyde dehydrogenase (NAD+)